MLPLVEASYKAKCVIVPQSPPLAVNSLATVGPDADPLDAAPKETDCRA